MTPTDLPPVGLDLARTAKLMSQAFDAALAESGGTLPVWLALFSIKSQTLANQRQHAAAIGIQGATLTHHLNALEKQGLLIRRRDPSNRRVHQVELTEDGELMFVRLRQAALAFDARLRAGLSGHQLAAFADVLATLRANIEQ
jgi:MarR family transcriptional regulator, transcriptional regulator for hemolysin